MGKNKYFFFISLSEALAVRREELNRVDADDVSCPAPSQVRDIARAVRDGYLLELDGFTERRLFFILCVWAQQLRWT